MVAEAVEHAAEPQLQSQLAAWAAALGGAASWAPRAALAEGLLLAAAPVTVAVLIAAAAGHDKIVKLIVDSGADVRMKDKNDDTALEYAEKNNRPKVKELLNLYACEYTW